MTRTIEGEVVLNPRNVWFRCAPDLWTIGRCTRVRRVFGRQEYYVLPQRGAGRWVAADAVDAETLIP